MAVQNSTGGLSMRCGTRRHQLHDRSRGDLDQPTNADSRRRPLVGADQFVRERSADAEQTCSLWHVQDGRQCGTLDIARRVAVLRPAPRLRSASHLADLGSISRCSPCSSQWCSSRVAAAAAESTPRHRHPTHRRPAPRQRCRQQRRRRLPHRQRRVARLTRFRRQALRRQRRTP